MAEKKGICRNYVNCTLADKEEIQIVDDLNFVCAECGKSLEPVDGKPAKVPMDPDKKRRLIIIGIAVVAIGIIVVCVHALCGKNDPGPNPPPDDGVDSIEVITGPDTDTVVLPPPPPLPPSRPVKWNGVATYEGQMQGGKPHGLGGTLKFNSYYTLDLKDGNGTKIYIKPGESIHNVKMDHGALIQGELHRNDGTRPWINIGH